MLTILLGVEALNLEKVPFLEIIFKPEMTFSDFLKREERFHGKNKIKSTTITISLNCPFQEFRENCSIILLYIRQLFK